MRCYIFLILTSSLSIAISQNTLSGKGFAVIRGERVEGNISINVEGGSISIKQEGVNKVYLLDIEHVVINDEADEFNYVTKEVDGKSTFTDYWLTETFNCYKRTGS